MLDGNREGVGGVLRRFEVSDIATVPAGAGLLSRQQLLDVKRATRPTRARRAPQQKRGKGRAPEPQRVARAPCSSEVPHHPRSRRTIRRTRFTGGSSRVPRAEPPRK